MRILTALVVALPMAALAQSPTVIPDPMIPQAGVPGAGYPAASPRSQGVGVGAVAPIQGGGAVIVGPGYEVPGGAPTYIVPNGGGTSILTPGYGTTIVRPNPAGGTTIIGPNQPSTLIVPTQRGGSVILGPGGTGYAVPTPHGTYIQPPGSQPPVIIYDR